MLCKRTLYYSQVERTIFCVAVDRRTADTRAMIDSLPSQRLAVLIRSLRTEQGMSQEELAERAGLHRNFISLIERGKSQPTVDNVFRLANALEISAVELIQRISPIVGVGYDLKRRS